ncbi:hypothetical protein D3C78_1471130 [compost metagenome]
MLERAFLEQFFQFRDRAGLDVARPAFAGIDLDQLGGRVLDHFAAFAGGALEGGVMDHHQLVVG